jgi:PIN domain nuclease of toxin-antitoxin system
VGGRDLTVSRPVLLDTCASIWLMNGDKLSSASLEALRAAQAVGAVLVSPITSWEIAMLAARGRLILTRAPASWFAALLALPGVALAPMPPDVLISSATLPGTPPRDPADRIIAATARAYGHAIITRDAALLAYAQARHIDVIAC